MKTGRGNRSTRRKPAPAPLCPPQIPFDQTRARTRAAAVGSQRLTAWAMARPDRSVSLQNIVQQDITAFSTLYDLGHQLRKVKLSLAGHGSRAVWSINCLRLLGRCDRGFESRLGYGCLVCVRLFCV
jgi:hypothetical protein